MNSEFQSVFVRLRQILQRWAGTLSVKDSPTSYLLEGGVGPAALRAWGDEMRRRSMPVAWVEIGKTYVSFHLMSVYANPKLLGGMSKELKARMQGKTCFNFKRNDEGLFAELERLTAESLADFKKAGYVAEQLPG